MYSLDNLSPVAVSLFALWVALQMATCIFITTRRRAMTPKPEQCDSPVSPA